MTKVFTNIIHLESVDSTNSYLKREIHPGGTLVYTFNQTAGRGRHERKWLNFRDKNLALSLLFTPEEPVPNTTWHVAALSLALLNLLKSYKVKGAFLKWPNDIFVGERKISGVLAEVSWQGKSQRIIAGIGINVNSTEEELAEAGQPAASILTETGKPVELKSFTERYLKELTKWVTLLKSGRGIEKIKGHWLKNSPIIGRTIRWDSPVGPLEGKVTGIDDEGYLFIESGGRKLRIVSGDVKIVTPPS